MTINQQHIHDDEELIQLQQWKQNIGIPAQQQNEELLIVIEHLKEQNRSLTLELETYSHEVSTLENDKQTLSAEIKRSNTNRIDESHSLHTISVNNADLFELQKRCEQLQFQMSQSKETVAELTQNNTDVQTQNGQYKLIVDRLQKQVLSLQDITHQQSVKLYELQQKYSEVDEEYYTLQSVAKQGLAETERLKADLSTLTKEHHTALHTINSNEAEEQFGLFDTKKRTIRIKPQISASAAMQLSYTSMFAPSGGVGGIYTNSPLAKYQNYAYPPSMGNDAYNLQQIEQQLQKEFDDKMRIEMDKHKLEIEKLNQKVDKYKKKLLKRSTNDTDSEFKQMENGRARHLHNANNEQDMSKCKVLGWTMW